MNSGFEDISENIRRVRDNIGEALVRCGRDRDEVRIMAVTKTVPYERVNFAVSRGLSLLGENRVQEYLGKKEFYDSAAEVRFIGNLQSNKVKYIIDCVSEIQSVSSVSLAREISAQAKKHGRVMDILCEVNIGGEASKSGFSPEELHEAVCVICELDNIKLGGFMTIPPPGDSLHYFEKMQRIFEDEKASAPENADISLLSMGMSADYTDAVRFGSGMVRLGSAVFGSRNYSQ